MGEAFKVLEELQHNFCSSTDSNSNTKCLKIIEKQRQTQVRGEVWERQSLNDGCHHNGQKKKKIVQNTAGKHALSRLFLLR